jgi:putative phosphoesterase
MSLRHPLPRQPGGPPPGPLTVGVISDTHGLVRPEALAALASSQLILHAGDVGHAGVLEALRALAPVVAVRGNNDHGPWADALAEVETVEAGGVSILVIHDVKALGRRGPAGCLVVVAGHSHRPRCEVRDGVLWLNPGSAGPRRFRLPVTVGRLVVERGQATGEIIELAIA